MIRWPDPETVHSRLDAWVKAQAILRPELLRAGYFGSYARGDWGVGSDLDVILILSSSDQPFHQRALDWDLSSLPVPGDVLVYTDEEWGIMAARKERFYLTIENETVWIFER